jgi:predicted DNA-binding protein
MKAITINVSLPAYQKFKKVAKRLDRTTSELIREAMEEYLERRYSSKRSVFSIAPHSVGEVRTVSAMREDLLEEMTEGKEY